MNIKSDLKIKQKYLLLFGIAGMLIISAFITDFFFKVKNEDIQKQLRAFENRLFSAEKEAFEQLEYLQKTNKSGIRITSDSFNQFAKKKGITYLLYSNDSLINWSDNGAAFDEIHKQNIPPNKLIKLKNGWYRIFQKKERQYTYYALILIKSEYYIQNRYLQNHINPFLETHLGQEISFSEIKGDYPVYSSDHQYLFSLQPQKESNYNSHHTCLLFIYLSAILLICLGIHFFLLEEFKKPGKRKFFYLLLIPAIRILSTIYKFPNILYELDLFSPIQYASSFFLNSLGDFLINTILLVYLFQFIYKRLPTINSNNSPNRNPFIGYFIDIILFLIILFLSAFINYLLSGMIINSRINFNVNNIFELSIYSYIGVFITGALLYIFYLFTDAVVLYIHSCGRNYSGRIILFLASISIFGMTILKFHDSEIFRDYDIDTFLLALILILLIQFLRFYHSDSGNRLTLSRTMIVLFFFSIYSAQTLYEFNNKKEKEHLRLLSSKLLAERDYIAEYLFEDIESKISADTTMSQIFLTENENEIALKTDKRLHSLYLNSYWNKYDIRVFCFDEEGDVFPNTNNIFSRIEEYEKMIREQGQNTYGNHLYFLNNASGRISYLAFLPLLNSAGKREGSIVIDFSSKLIHEKTGFPELFLSEKVLYNQELSKYSYARYKNNELVNQSGNYSYYLNANIFEKALKTSNTIVYEDYEHFIYKPEGSTLVVISRPAEKTFTYFTFLSYFFAFYCISVFLFHISKHFYHKGFTFKTNFKARIQTAFMLIVFILMITIGGGTIYYIIVKNKEKQKETLEEKVTSLLVLLENEFNDRRTSASVFTEEQESVLNKLSTNIGTDFNIFNKNGSIAFSSQPRIYEAGIIGGKMNPEAWDKLHLNQRTFFTQTENIGQLRYVSAYQPIRDINNQVIGYLNLPYFARQSELNQEISSFIVVLINIYVLIFMLALLVVFLIADRLTQPLKIIREKLSSTRFGNKNEPIAWERKDEIGELVEVYNRMLEELSISAEKLARSERESAWREMAKQVAHEIKNPLTPMKLSVQYLQKAWEENSPQIDLIISRISKTLIEQIDTLSVIAGEFSNFAQMPKTEKQIVNLGEVINNTLTLYGGMNGILLSVEVETDKATFVLADKNQLLRVFNNLIKNAIQSIPEGRQGIIKIRLQIRNENYFISITDNGVGIPAEKIPFIFSPNFTTKTAGMGLGLAMVKSIIEGSEGKIWFETSPDKGTSFFVSLPIQNPKNI